MGYSLVLATTRFSLDSALYERHNEAIQRGTNELWRLRSNNTESDTNPEELTALLTSISSNYHIFWAHPEGDHESTIRAPQTLQQKHLQSNLLKTAEKRAESGTTHALKQLSGEYNSSTFQNGERHYYTSQTEITINKKPWELYLLQDFTLEHRQQRNLELLILIAAASAITLGTMINDLGIRRALKPLRSLSQEIQTKGSSVLHAEPLQTVGRASELSELVNSFNALYERLKNSIQRQTEMVTAMSHELLTPISLIQGHTSRLLRRNPDLEQGVINSIQQVGTQSSRLYRLTHVLLDLARQGASTSSVKIEPVALIELASEMGALVASQAHGEILLPDEICEPTVCLEADRQRLLQALEELTDHAISHGGSTKEKPATFSCKAASGKMRISLQIPSYPYSTKEIQLSPTSFLRKKADSAIDGGGLSLAVVNMLLKSIGSELSLKDLDIEGIEIFFDLNLSTRVVSISETLNP